MEKQVLQPNPVPSYIHTIGNKIHATFLVQKFTCKYFGEVASKTSSLRKTCAVKTNDSQPQNLKKLAGKLENTYITCG